MSTDNISTSERSSLLASSNTSHTLADSDEALDSTDEIPQLSVRRATLLCLSIFTLIFILTCNVSLLTTIQSSIATELEAFSLVSWFTSSYLIAITSIITVAGRLSKIFTSRVYLLASIIIQSFGLLITSQARSFRVFVLGRALTGIGGAAVTPVAFILVTELTSTRRRGLLFGCINTAYTVGVAIGAIIAGALEPVVGWRAVFWLQIPLTLSAATLAFFAIPQPREDMKASMQSATLQQKIYRIDYFGVVTLISAVVLFLYGLSTSEIQITPIIFSIAALILFVFVEANWANEPIVPITVLRSRGNILTGLATVGIMTARWGVLFYTPIYAIAIRGWSQASAGLLLIPTNAGFAFGGLLSGWLHIRRSGSFYFSCVITMLLFSAATFVISQMSTATFNVYGYVAALFVNGFITGALLNYSIAHVLYLTPPSTHVIVIPLNAMFRVLSGSFGSSIAGGIFLRSLETSLSDGFKDLDIPNKSQLIQKLIGTPVLVHKLTGIEKRIAIDGYTGAIHTLFLAGSVLALLTVIIQAGTGWTAPKDLDSDDLLSNHDPLSPIVSREPAAG